MGCDRDYDRTMTLLTEFGTKKGDRGGDHKIKQRPWSVPTKPIPLEARPREGEQLIMLCGQALAGAASPLP